jgi:C1A family cysteine protease
MRIYSYFRDLGPDGQLPMPQDGDVMVGGHAVLAVGYDDALRVLIVRNSFGAAWGAEGYFYLPYAYVTGEDVLDLWASP